MEPLKRINPMKKMPILLALLLLGGCNVLAADDATAPEINTGDTAWVLMSTALVLLMTPGLALFYAGMVRKKNVVAMTIQCFAIIALISVQWVLFGYTLAFGPDLGGMIGGLDWIGLKGVGGAPNADYAATIPHVVFMMFQAMFAIITPALILGAFADRIKFSTLLVFTLLWSTIVYDPVAHWVWGVGGWIRNTGALDFAGGTVVHITAGISALAAALIIGPRKGFGNGSMKPHNVPMIILGGGILWFGWFGFNAGSALGANELAANAFLVTNTAAAAAALSWMLISWVHMGKPNAVGIVTGGVVGLVAITPASGFVGPLEAIAIGAIASIVSYTAMYLKSKYSKIDDSLDVFACHGLGGTFGALATGLFASKAVNSAGADGLIYGNPGLLWTQFMAVAATMIYSFVVTLVLFKLLDMTMGLRVSEEEEIVGLDIASHGEEAYT
ncbi:MAG: ammonium transporter [Candidatus Altiarchaeia archaeon]